MSRFAPALLVCLLACTSSTRADDAFPPLDQRLGRTITVVEKNFPTEKAVITQVWRLDDGTPCMQAMGQTSKTQMTLVENTSAKTVVDRIKIHRWLNGVCPVGCPVAPATKTPSSTVKQTQYEAPKAVVSAPSSDKVASTEGGLMPVLPKKEEVIVAPPAVITPAPVVTRTLPSTVSVPVTPTLPSVNTVPVTPTLPSVREVPPLPPVTPPATVVVKQPVSAPAVIKTVPATTIQPPPVPTQPAAVAPAPTVAKPELVGGCEVITVTENGNCRKYKVIGTARDAHGVMTQRCQALDNGEIVTLNCDNCSKGTACATAAPCKPACTTPAPIACTPAPVKCEPAKVVCTPAPVKCEPAPVAVKCEPAKVVSAPTTCTTECKPCVTAPKACEPCVTATKTCDPCATAGNKACDACTTTKSCDSCTSGHHCLDKKCGVCGGAEGGCDACRGKNSCGLGGCGGWRMRIVLPTLLAVRSGWLLKLLELPA